MRAFWAIAAGLLLGAGSAWWLSRDHPQQAAAKRERASEATRQQAEAAQPPLYRWRDAAGSLHITDQPPSDHPYQRIDREQTTTISIEGGNDHGPAE